METLVRSIVTLGALLCVGCPQPPAAKPAAPAASAAQLPAGRHTFELDWSASTRAPDVLRPGETTSASLELEARLVVDVPQADGMHNLARVTLTDISRFAWVASAEEVDPSGGQLEGCSAWMDLGHGPPSVLLHEEPLAPGCQHVLTHVAVNLDLLPPDSGKRRSVLGNYGRGFADYASDPQALSRRLHGTTEAGLGFAGRSRVDLDQEGRPLLLEAAQWVTDNGDEQRVHARAEVRLERTAFDPGLRPDAPAVHSLLETPLEATLDGSVARQQQAAAFADGLDPQMLQLVLAGIDDGARLAPGFAIRARGLMIAQPEVAHGVAEAFDRARSGAARQVVADMLAQADTPEAQAVLRDLVNREVGAGADDRSLILQRLAFVDHPEPATLELALRLHTQATHTGDRVVVLASMHLLGELARRLRDEHPLLARVAMTRIRTTLAEAEEPALIAAALGGLGNAGDPADLPRVLDAIATHDDRIRSLGALALRRMPGPSVEPTLLTLLNDNSALVKARASSALSLRGEVQPSRAAG